MLSAFYQTYVRPCAVLHTFRLKKLWAPEPVPCSCLASDQQALCRARDERKRTQPCTCLQFASTCVSYASAKTIENEWNWHKMGTLSNLKTWQNMTHVNYGLTMVWPSQAAAPLARKQLQHWTASCWAHAPFSSQGKESLAPSRILYELFYYSMISILFLYERNTRHTGTEKQYDARWIWSNRFLLRRRSILAAFSPCRCTGQANIHACEPQLLWHVLGTSLAGVSSEGSEGIHFSCN